MQLLHYIYHLAKTRWTMVDNGIFLKTKQSGSPNYSCNARCDIFIIQINTVSGTLYETINLTRVWLSILIKKEDQKPFTFTWDEQKSTFIALHQGYFVKLYIVMMT